MESRQEVLNQNILDRVMCPLTLYPYNDPYILNCGHSFSKGPLEESLKIKNCCPVCRNPVTSLIPNYALRDLVQEVSEFGSKLIEIQFNEKRIVDLITENRIDGVVKIFKAHQEKINEIIDDHQTVLHLAINKKNIKLIEALIANFPELNINEPLPRSGDIPGASPLLLALQLNTNALLPITYLLLKHGADPSIPTLKGLTPLMQCLWAQNWELATAILDTKKSGNINQTIHINRPWDGFTALITAVDKNCPDALFARLLAFPEIDLNIRAANGKSALYLAAEKGDAAKVSALLAQPNIDIEAKCIPGNERTAMQAAEAHPEVAALFTAYPVRIALLKSKVTAGSFAEAALIFREIYLNNNAEAISQLKTWLAESINPTFCKVLLPVISSTAFERDDIELILKLVRANRDSINECTIRGCNILQYACLLDKANIIEALIENFQEIDINANSKLPESGRATALIIGARLNATTAVSTLLKLPGIDVNKTTAAGNSALSDAARNNFATSTKLLLEFPQTEFQINALKHAEQNGYEKLAALLGCFYLLTNFLEEQELSHFKMEYIRQIDRLDLDFVFRCMQQRGHDENMLGLLHTILFELRSDLDPLAIPKINLFANGIHREALRFYNTLFDIAHKKANHNPFTKKKFDYEVELRKAALTDLRTASCNQEALLALRREHIFAQPRHPFDLRSSTGAQREIDKLRKNSPKPR